MKKLLFLPFLFFASCSSVYTTSADTNNTDTRIKIETNNFKNLGFFVGVSSIKKKTINLKEREALVSQAKRNMIAAAGENYKIGSSTVFINQKVEFLENRAIISCTISADLIEFVK